MTPPDTVPSRPSRRAALLGVLTVTGAAACSTDPGVTPAPAGTAPRTAPATATRTPSGAPTPSPSATGAGPTDSAGPHTTSSLLRTDGPDIRHGPRTREEVALTFHGQGTRALTDAVLAACATAGATVTVFAVGTWVHGDPAQVRAVAAAGHDVGNHTWSHQQMPSLPAATARAEVARGRSALVTAGIEPGLLFRPSGTARSTPTILAAARRAGYHRCVSYDVDPQDYLDPGATLVRRRTRTAVRAGSIVSLHLGHQGTAEALPGILSDLSRAGLRAVALTTLLRD